ncbi:MAG: molybdenum cofactor guanylyltransferase [Planctomycetia bacterium]
MTVLVRPAAIGIVLAGGASRRMQPPDAGAGERRAVPPVRKEWIEIGGRTLLARVVDAIAAATSRTIVVAAPGRPLPPLSRPVEVVYDSAPGAGPLAALLDGLRAIGHTPAEPFVFVSSCDVPLLDTAVVRLLLERAAATAADWIVPEIAGHPQVLTSVVRRTLIGPITAWLASGRRDPRGLLEALRGDAALRIGTVAAGEIAAVDPRLDSFRDVDTPAACAEIIRQLPYGDGGGTTYTSPS